MEKYREWQRWSWDELYSTLTRENGRGEVFEVARDVMEDPLRCGALRSPGGHMGWNYRFVTPGGGSLYVRELGSRYAVLLQEGPRAEAESEDVGGETFFTPAFMTAAGAMLVLIGGLWAALESAARLLG